MRSIDNNPRMDDSYEYRGFVDRLMKLPYVDITKVEHFRDGWAMMFQYNTVLATQLDQLAGKIYSDNGQTSQPLGSLDVTNYHKATGKSTQLAYKVDHSFNYNDLILIFGRLVDVFDKTIAVSNDAESCEPTVKSDRRCETHTRNAPVCRSISALDKHLYIKQIVHIGKKNNLELRARRLNHIFNHGVTQEQFLDLAKTKESYRNLTTKVGEETAIIKWLSAAAPTTKLTADDFYTALAVQLIYNGYINVSSANIARILEFNYPWTWNLAMTEEQRRLVSGTRITEFDPNLYLKICKELDSGYDGSQWITDFKSTQKGGL